MDVFPGLHPYNLNNQLKINELNKRHFLNFNNEMHFIVSYEVIIADITHSVMQSSHAF